MLLLIGNKTYSSWSLRPWILLRHFGIPFDEKLIRLGMPDTTENILKYSPSGRVPALIDGEIVIWDSLAIMEYVNEKFPQKGMWPSDPAQRAVARSVAYEMHSSFTTMRTLMSHHLKREVKNFDWSPAKEDIRRVKEIWSNCLNTSRGKFLFGDFSIADAMYAPVVNRFISYGVPIEAELKPYADTLRNLPAHQDWIREALAEDFTVPRYE